MKKILTVLFALAALPSFAHCIIEEMDLDRESIYSDERAEVVVRGVCTDSAIPLRAVVHLEAPNEVAIEFVFAEAGAQVPTRWGERVRLPRLFPNGSAYSIEARTRDDQEQRILTVRERTFRITPDKAVGGTAVLIEGVPVDGAPVTVTFGGVAAFDVRGIGGGGITAIVPQGSGTVDVKVQTGQQTYTLAGGFAYDAFDPERVLFPVNFIGSGANGSQWRTDIRVQNDGVVAVDTQPGFYIDPAPPTLPIPVPTIPPGGEGRFPMVTRDGGAFLYMPRGQEKQLSYAAHIVDLSRTTTDLGAEMPVVRAEDTANVIRLPEVPVESRYRGRLRIYNFDPVTPLPVRVTITGPDQHAAVIVTRMLALTSGPLLSAAPAFAVLDLDQIPQLQGRERVDVTIEPVTREARIWAFVSVTNNETQHVTLHTPQHRTRPQ